MSWMRGSEEEDGGSCSQSHDGGSDCRGGTGNMRFGQLMMYMMIRTFAHNTDVQLRTGSVVAILVTRLCVTCH